MRRALVLLIAMASFGMTEVYADETKPVAEVGVETVEDAVRVTLVRVGGAHTVTGVTGGGAVQSGCLWTVNFTPSLEDTPYGVSAGPQPHPDARFALLLCNGSVVRAIWVSPDDVVDLDAAARAEAERYIREVLTPAVAIGVNPAATGLAGLASWFWIDGFSGTLTAPPIAAFGLTIDVRMSSGSVTWDFGDGATVVGDLGRAYPEASTVRHAHQDAGTFTVTAVIDLVPEYRVDGGPWLTLPNLSATATTTHQVQERQPVIVDM